MAGNGKIHQRRLASGDGGNGVIACAPNQDVVIVTLLAGGRIKGNPFKIVVYFNPGHQLPVFYQIL